MLVCGTQVLTMLLNGAEIKSMYILQSFLATVNSRDPIASFVLNSMSGSVIVNNILLKKKKEREAESMVQP